MTALALVITTAGLEKFTAAQADDDIDLTVAQVGLTDAEFVVAPTLTDLPGEFRRFDTISGEAVGDNIVHLTIRDDADIAYTARGFGLFLADGTLFAVYGQADQLFQKSPLTSFYIAIDISFPTSEIDDLTFGDTNFINPPATTARRGVIELATEAETLAGTDTVRAVPPRHLKTLLDTLYLSVGFVSMWYGEEEDVPAGWAICDGRTVARTDGAGDITTPDLRNRTPVGVSGAHELGTAFGGTSKTVDSAPAGAHTPAGTLPAHGHDVTLNGTTDAAVSGVTISTTRRTLDGGESGSAVDTITVNDPPHSHGIEISGSTDSAGPLELSMEEVPAHQHSVTIDVTQPSLALYFIMRV